MSKLIVKQRYGITPNSILNNSDISLKAKGLFTFIQSKPDNWRFSVEKIALQNQDGEDSIRTGLQELEKVGLLVRQKSKDDTGQWKMDYILSENPVVENPRVEKPSTGLSLNNSKQDYSKQDLVNKDISGQEEKQEIDEFLGFPLPEGWSSSSYYDSEDNFIPIYKNKFGHPIKQGEINHLKKEYTLKLKYKVSSAKAQQTKKENKESVEAEMVRILQKAQNIPYLDGANNLDSARSFHKVLQEDLMVHFSMDTKNDNALFLEQFRSLLELVKNKSDFHWKNLTSMGYLVRNFNKIKRDIK